MTVAVETYADSDEAVTSGPMSVLWPLLALAVPAAIHLLLEGDDVLFFAVGAFLVIVAIAGRGRMRWERWLIDRNLPEREAWLPAAYLLMGFLLGAFSASTIGKTFVDEIDIIVFILAFSLVSEGISRSGLFHYFAYRIAERCDGSTSRLIFYLFVLASILTAFTSNDIVVLSLTPIVMSVCAQARITNVRLIMLGTYIAANTLAMVLIIGSPSNIILAESVGVNAFVFTLVMLVPAVFAFLLTYVVINRIVTQVEQSPKSRRFGPRSLVPRSGWEYNETYQVPPFTEYHEITRPMRQWMWMFGAAVVALFVVSTAHVSLLWCAVPTAVGSLLLSSNHRNNNRPDATRWSLRTELAESRSLLAAMPWGILFFGITFFVVAEAFSGTKFFGGTLQAFMTSSMVSGNPFSTVASTGISGVLVSLFNDLPASALLGKALGSIAGAGQQVPVFNKWLAFTGVVVGINIGTFIVPTGALAGIIWFRLMGREARRCEVQFGMRERLKIPRRTDLVRYGLTVFLSVGVGVGIMTFGLFGLVAYLLSGYPQLQVKERDFQLRPAQHPKLLTSPFSVAVAVVGLMLCLATVLWFRRALKERNVVLAHFGELLSVASRFSAWALKHRVAYATLAITSLAAVAASLMYWAETAHAGLYFDPRFVGPREFVVWLIAFVGSGYELQKFPHSLFGILLAGVLPLLGVAMVVQIVRAPSSANRDRLRLRLAQGEARSDRTVIVGDRFRDRALVEQLVRHSDRFVVLFDRSGADGGSLEIAEDLGDRTYVGKHVGGAGGELVETFHLLDAREVVLLSDGTAESDYDNIRTLGAIDDALQMSRSRITDDGVRAPSILLECSSADMQSLLGRSISRDLARLIKLVPTSSTVGRWVGADVVSRLATTDELYGFTRRADDRDYAHLDVTGLEGRFHFASERVQLDALALELGLDPDRLAAVNSLDGNDRLHIKQMRKLVADWLVRQVDRENERRGGAARPLRQTMVFGVEVKADDSLVLAELPSLALIEHQGLGDSLVVLSPGPRPSGDLAAATSERVHLVNVTEHTRAVVAELEYRCRVGDLSGVELIVHGADEIRSAEPNLRVVSNRSTDPVALVGALLEPGSEYELRRGDKMYVFAHPHRGNQADLESLRFLRSLDSAMQQVGPSGAASSLEQHEIYVAVESWDSSTRFLLEHLSVDMILDSDSVRAAFFRGFVDAYFRLPAESGVPAGWSASDFAAASEFADRFRFTTLLPAKDSDLELPRLAGHTFAEASQEVLVRSSPPHELLGVVRARSVGAGSNRRIEVEFRVPGDDDELADNDRLVLISVI